jgi:diguanylate cyclase (GGDEF)-like protein/PAS domain S-box-containing protein
LEKVTNNSAFAHIGRSRHLYLLAAFVIVTCCSLLLISGLNEWNIRAATLKSAEVDQANLAGSLIQHSDDTFELADSLVTGLVDQLEANGTHPAAIANVQRFIDLRSSTWGRIRGLFVYDDKGRWLATSEKVSSLSAFNNSDREYFRKHREEPSSQLLIGDPIRSRSGGQWIVTASRRFNLPDGSFGGVVLATVNSLYFSDFYKRFDIGPNGTILLMTASGKLVARSVDNDAHVGSDISDSALIKELRSHPLGKSYASRSPFDNRWRLGHYKVSRKYPILVSVTQPESEVLAAWRHNATFRVSLVAALTVGIAGFGAYLLRALAQRQRLAAALLSTEADFRLLAEASSDMVMRIDLDENIRYISPSCTRILGWDATQLMGRPALAGIHPDDLTRVRETVTDLKKGVLEETKLIYRNRSNRGKSIWLETTLHVTRSVQTGQIDGVVAISRDMTEHKDLELKLAALAAQDGLTGLANRRRFDEKLGEEWKRAIRDKTPISLLMIDVDQFKRYNDNYGHPSGDRCLTSIGHILAKTVHRPGDIAARYGGEEFVLLLPNTDEAGCAVVGDRIRQSLLEQRIPHASNPPSRFVTVSIGGATARPGADSPEDEMSLIAAADHALYVAKNSGRDRVVMSGKVVHWRGAESA